MKSADRRILLLLIAVTLLSAAGLIIYRAFAPQGERAIIEVENRPVQTVYLTPGGEPRTISVQGRMGESLIGVDGEFIYMIESACPDKVCIHMGRISRAGQVVVCLPNRVVIRITGEPDLP